MPGPKPKPSEVAVEAKRTYIPYIEKRYPDLLAKSFAYSDVDHLTSSGDKNKLSKKLRVAVIDGDSVDIALKWNQEESRTKAQDMKRRVCSNELRIPLVLPVDEKRAGGDWESGSMAPEENLSRRSNLVHCLSRHRAVSSDSAAYPIPSKGGLYSPHVGEAGFLPPINQQSINWRHSRFPFGPSSRVQGLVRVCLAPSDLGSTRTAT